MDQARASVFDLSPAEKLQLVEDLWDDLAATPADVPVHDWQLRELECRKDNLRRKPSSTPRLGDVTQCIRDPYGHSSTIAMLND